jgi:hypothetical protein
VLSAAFSIVLAPLSLAATALRLPSMVPGSFVSYAAKWRHRWDPRA